MEKEDIKIVTICGSTKLKDQYKYWEKILTLEGKVVLSAIFFHH
jgi:hypothetical protein